MTEHNIKSRRNSTVSVNAGEYVDMYREYAQGEMIENLLEVTEVGGELSRKNFKKLNGCFTKNGLYILKQGEIQRYIGEDRKMYFCILQYERLVDSEEFYSYLYPMICFKIYQIDVEGMTVKVIEDEVFVKALQNYKARSSSYESLKTLKELESLIGLDEGNFRKRQGALIMRNVEVGEKFIVKVKAVFEKYALVSLKDSEETSFILHVSKLRDAYISDARKYLYQGQEIQVKVVSKDGGKIQVSSLDMPLCKADANYYAQNRNWMPSYLLEKEINKCKAEVRASKFRVVSDEQEGVVQSDNETASKTIKNADAGEELLDEVAAFIENKTGKLSEEARQKLKVLISKYGLFKLGMGVEKTMKNFNIDPALYLMNKTEELLNVK